MEIFITGIIIMFAIYVLVNSIKSSSKGKCSGGCKHCSLKEKCSTDNK